MDKISVVYTFSLDNGGTCNVTIKDINAGATSEQILALGNKLIEKGWQSKGNLFTSIVKTVKVTTMEETL